MSNRTILALAYHNDNGDVEIEHVAVVIAPTLKQALENVDRIVKDDWKKRQEDHRNDPDFSLTSFIRNTNKQSKDFIVGRYDIFEDNPEDCAIGEGYQVHNVGYAEVT